ncbi:YecA family protein [Microbispora sp. CA-102843]|uniref:YecA family protein n=1 Tax=Microbispora sp. CA-102843 TaxID=3239952 RepID=UPI003D8DFA41
MSQPWFSLAAIEDPLGVELYRDMITKVWNGQLRGSRPALTPQEVRLIMAFLDDAPISHQALIGRWTLRKRDEIRGSVRTASGCSVFQDRLFVYMCSSADAWSNYDAWVAELGALMMVRLLHWRESRGSSAMALGIGVREVDNGVEYTYLYTSGPVAVPADIRAHIEWKYGVANLAHGSNRPMTPGRNDPCPCGSRSKFKRCHGAPGRREA